VIGLPVTAFPEKLIQRVFKEKYLSSNFQFVFVLLDVAVMLRATLTRRYLTLRQSIDCGSPASSSAGKKGFRANGGRNSRNKGAFVGAEKNTLDNFMNVFDFEC
jgi:hypothetical protein